MKKNVLNFMIVMIRDELSMMDYMRKIDRERCNDMLAFSMLVLARRFSQAAKST